MQVECTQLNFVASSLHLSYSSPVGHKATTMFCHKVLSLAEARALPRDCLFSFSSAITVCRHVIFGRPRFPFPGGVHLSATLGMQFVFIACSTQNVMLVDVPIA